jgi:hypothetical protein
VIDSFAPVDPALVDVVLPEHDGYPDEIAAADTPDAMRDACGAAARDFPDGLWIDAKDREDKARENDKNKTWGINYLDRFTNQDPSHECTCHALRASAEAARNRARGLIFSGGPVKGKRYEESARGSVFLSPLSVYPIANPRRYGGAGCIQVLDISCRNGFIPDKIQPAEYGFKHTLQGTTGRGGINQSSGAWITERQFPDGWKETAKHFKPLEIIVTTDWEQALCMLLHGIVLGYGRKGHAVPPSFWNVASNVYGYTDSYDLVRYDSASTFRSAVRSGVYGIVTMTTPDDWMKPAGN